MNQLITLLQKKGAYRVLPWLLFVVGLSLTTLEVGLTLQREQAVAQAEFAVRASELSASLERQLLAKAQILRGVAGLFASSDEVTHDEFHRYAAGLKLTEYHPDIQAIGYVRLVPDTEKHSYLAGVRKEGHADYAIWPAGERASYAPVVCNWPDDWQNRRAVGFDMFVEPVRTKAAVRARDAGRAAMSEKVQLVQDDGQAAKAGVIMLLPLYRPGVAVNTVEERRAALLGWTYLALRTGEFMEHYLRQEYPELSGRLALRVYDGEGQEPSALLYELPPSAPDSADLYPQVHSIRRLGGAWTLALAVPAPSFAKRLADSKALAILMVGALLAILLALAGKLIADSHRHMAAALAKTEAANQVLREQEAALRLASAVMETSPGGIAVTDAYRRFITVNPAFTAMMGYSLADLDGKPLQVLESGRQSDQFYRELWRTAEADGNWEGELVVRRQDGGLLPVMAFISRVLNETGDIVNYVGLFFDITERRKAEERIHHLAHHDYLTGLPNRLLLVERATQALALARRYQRRMAIIFIDLDRFKPINDEHGHDAGDAVLRAVAQRLSALVRQSDTVCRQGGDEFVILLPEFSDLDSLAQLAHKLRQAIEEPCEFEGQQLTVSGSVGIATFPENGDTVDTIIQSADSAMYRAKADGKHVCFARRNH